MEPKSFEKHEIEALKDAAATITFTKRLGRVVKWLAGTAIALKSGWVALRWLWEAMK